MGKLMGMWLSEVAMIFLSHLKTIGVLRKTSYFLDVSPSSENGKIINRKYTQMLFHLCPLRLYALTSLSVLFTYLIRVAIFNTFQFLDDGTICSRLPGGECSLDIEIQSRVHLSSDKNITSSLLSSLLGMRS